MKLNPLVLGLTLGILWAAGVFIMTWWIILFDGATGEPTFLGKVYRGYEISALGSVIGLIWAFGDGLVCGVIFGWLYNRLAARMARAA